MKNREFRVKVAIVFVRMSMGAFFCGLYWLNPYAAMFMTGYWFVKTLEEIFND